MTQTRYTSHYSGWSEAELREHRDASLAQAEIQRQLATAREFGSKRHQMALQLADACTRRANVYDEELAGRRRRRLDLMTNEGEAS